MNVTDKDADPELSVTGLGFAVVDEIMIPLLLNVTVPVGVLPEPLVGETVAVSVMACRSLPSLEPLELLLSACQR